MKFIMTVKCISKMKKKMKNYFVTKKIMSFPLCTILFWQLFWRVETPAHYIHTTRLLAVKMSESCVNERK